MSRTYRRKGWEKTVKKTDGSKVNGYYTTWDTYGPKINGHEGEINYRPMTKREKVLRYIWLHGDSRPNHWSPSKAYRQEVKVKLQTHNKREMSKYLRLGQEYEPNFMEDLPSIYQYWLMY